MSAISSSTALPAKPILKGALRRLLTSLAILLAIAYLAQIGLLLAERGRAGVPAQPLDAALQALVRMGNYLLRHPATYYWHRAHTPALQVVSTLFARSAALLVLAVAAAGIIGVPLGIAAALSRRRGAEGPLLLLSILGISTPSFLLAMLLWILNNKLYIWLGLKHAPLPPTGFGWDAHLLMPVLVLAVRPLAQVVRVTYVSMAEVLGKDYIRTALAKGQTWPRVVVGHALRNVLVPILTTLGTSLRFSLASLPVVESFFVWPGVGHMLLEAVKAGPATLVTDLLVSLGLIFLVINLALEAIYRVVDPRLRGAQDEEALEERRGAREQLGDLKYALRDLVAQAGAWVAGLRRWLPGQWRKAHVAASTGTRGTAVASLVAERREEVRRAARAERRLIVRSALRNPALMLGTVLVLGFFALALFGHRLAAANPYETHGIMTIEGVTSGPPFAPSSVFPWGSDLIGRDVQALVLAGAKQTLALALAATVARVLLGTFLGLLAGWRRGGWFERLVNWAVAVWAAFPVTLFAMIVILALGIEQGMAVFVVGLCVVGWGEIAQFVRAQVIAVKPQLHIEAARSVGVRPGRILTWHVLPQVLEPLLVLAVLETGGVLMLLAELGFLNIFLGGGFKVEMLGTRLDTVVYHFSDVPEWGALLANVRNWWRSYPWLAWWPGLAVFLAILAFNLWGEGMRRFLEESRINVTRLVNRYSVLVTGVLVVALAWTLRSTAPMEVYRPVAVQFDAERALEDVRALASPEYAGRETGTPEALAAAEYIAQRMEEIGLFPAGERDTYIQALANPRYHLEETPRLEIVDGQGKVVEALNHRQDFAEYTGRGAGLGEGEGSVSALVLGPDPESGRSDPYGLRQLDVKDRVLLVRQVDLPRIDTKAPAGVLIVSEDALAVQRKYLLGTSEDVVWDPAARGPKPVLLITPELAERLLATVGSSLAELDRTAASLPAGGTALSGPGVTLHLKTRCSIDYEPPDNYYHVIGFIPGTGQLMKGGVRGLDSNVIMVSAYYDGLGTDPNGTLYPGANDNASGVAAMLEMARVLKASPYQPKKTVVFVAWAGGERAEDLSVKNVMNAKTGFSTLLVEAVLDLSGLGAGDGHGLALGEGTSFKLVQLFQDAGSRLGVPVTTRGRGPHFGLPIRSGWGGRSALSAYLSWDGSDRTAHTPADTVETIDVAKLRRAGQTILLVVNVLSREVNY